MLAMAAWCAVLMALTIANGVSSFAMLDTYYFTVNPQSSMRVNEGSQVTLQCDVNNRNQIEFHWKLNDVRLEDDSRRYRQGSNLFIERVDRELDEGEFKCDAQNVSSGWLITSSSASLTIQYLADQSNVNLRRPRHQQLTEGMLIVMRCETSGFPEPDVFWYKNKIRIFEEDGEYAFLEASSRLKIPSVRVEDNGVYTCESRNSAGTSPAGRSFLLNVQANRGDRVLLHLLYSYTRRFIPHTMLLVGCLVLSILVGSFQVYCCCIENIQILDKLGANSAYLADEVFQRTTVTTRGSTVWLHCSFQNAVSVHWYLGARNSNLIINGTRPRVFLYNNGTIRIDDVRRSDEGTYLCEGLGADQITQSFTAQLLLARLDRMDENNLNPRIDLSKKLLLASGTRFEVDCIRPDSAPVPNLRWLNDEGQILLNGDGVFVEGTRLIIEQAEVDHSSTYTCEASNMAGRRSISFELYITVPPVLVTEPQNTEIQENDHGVLECAFEGSPIPWTTVEWSFNGQPIPQLMLENRMVIINEETGSLTIARAHTDMEGSYRCRVETELHQPVQSRAAYLNVIKKLKFSPIPESHNFEIGQSGSIRCNAEAEIPPTVKWMQVPPTNLVFPEGVRATNGLLEFTDITKDHAREYTCVAISGASRINTTIRVQVGIKPRITTMSANMSISEGLAVIMDCLAEGDPVPKVNWYKENIKHVINATYNSRYRKYENGSLSISPVYINDQALYGCMAGNSHGFARREIVLTVTTVHPFAGNGSFMVLDSNSTVDNRVRDEKEINLMKTVVIAVCSALAYLALVISLTVWCSIRLMKKKKLAKQTRLGKESESQPKPHLEGLTEPAETDKLMNPEQVRLNGGSLPNGNSSIRQYGRQRVVVDETSSSPRTNTSQSAKTMPKFNRSKLTTIGVLGKGAYGEVFLAKAPGLVPKNDEQLVYVKSLMSKEEVIQVEFRSEAEMFNKLNHSRVCKLFALCKNQEPIYMVMEYCEWGDLKQFLRATADENRQLLTIEPPNTSQKVLMCHQVAIAMDHLSNLRYVHKDLATRNILLEPNLSVKVACLALSRDIYASEYVQSRSGLLLPLRWTSPEAWFDEDYSTKSDVWAFGCFLYEVFSRAEIPLKDLTNEEVIGCYETETCISLKFPSDMPRQIQSLAHQCISISPRDRPDFQQIVNTFASFRSESRH